MIRILHTADWHIGQTLRGHSRAYEHQRAFDHLATIIAEREVDALVMAGDVFDSQNPSGDAQRLLYDTLARFSRLRPGLTIVLTAGNHDAAGRLEAPRPLLEAFNIHAVGNVHRRDGRVDAERHLVPLKDRHGAVAAHVLAVSYPTAACLPHLAALEEAEGSPVARAVAALYGELMDALRPRFAGLPLVVTGHLHVAGGIESEGAERRILVGGQHAVPADVFPAEAAYVALGHLHKPQAVGRESVRYSGSLFPLSAAEQPYGHGATLVTLEGGGITIEPIPIPRPVPFLRLPAAGEVRLTDLADHLKALDLPPGLLMRDWPFVQVRLAREGLAAGFREEVDRIAEGFPVRLVETRVAPLPEAPARAGEADAFQRLAERDPEDLFRLAFARRLGAEPEAAHLDVFHRVRAEL